ncbi:hypothetical protein F1737_09090 [Methanoplanus sp. FWC-SCC4]|uniref:Uncharacterized protein n=1 Tax=Methanochimaera problematica TaxID=2609417 RepID=A0AA97FE23_9EURY|nr:hypothetical protein [Methanoplanus sp. FWC-SCC4]WOF16832.1 hypothetical protein F1737_09090 [Methanoplanus sp. FWC-SCC4]
MTGYAKLNEKEIKGIKECEDEMGVIMVAYEKTSPVAKLTESQIEKIKSIEAETGLKLVAYE